MKSNYGANLTLIDKKISWREMGKSQIDLNLHKKK